MTAIVTALVLAYLVMTIAPDAPAARAVRRLLVDAPASWLARLSRQQVVVTTLVIGGTALVVAIFGHEAARAFAIALPELASWMTMFEITAYLDALIATATAFATARLAGLKAWVRTIRLTGRPRPRGNRTRRQRSADTGRKPANDDRPVFALAA